MRTRVDDIINEFMITLPSRDFMEDCVLQQLLDQVRESFGLEMIYIQQNMMSKYRFYYSFVSAAAGHSRREGICTVKEANYWKLFHCYDQRQLHIGSLSGLLGEEEDGRSWLHFGFLERTSYLGSLGFRREPGYAWTEEEKLGILKLAGAVRMYLSMRAVSEQANKIEYRVINALQDIYCACFYVKLEEDCYYAVHITPEFEAEVPYQGCYSETVERLVKGSVYVDDQERVREALSVRNIRRELSMDQRSFYVDHRVVHKDEDPWRRMMVVLVDVGEQGQVREALVTLQDISADREMLENSREAFGLLRDSYYRISAIDLNINRMKNLKLVESEWEDEQRLKGDFSKLIEACARKHVMPEYQEKFIQLLNSENLKEFFRIQRHSVVFSYQRLVDGECKWVQTEVVPVDNYSEENARVVWYVKNITDQKAKEAEHQDSMFQANAALRDAYEAANRANSAKTDFMSRMSHDIRTPMNAIIGMTAIAAANLDDKERLKDWLGKITVSSRHLLALINEVLDMSRIESGKLSLNKEEFNLPDLLENMLNIIKPSIDGKGHELQVRVKDITHENVIGDTLRIQQVFVNIAGNAIKYTPDGGKLCISIQERPTEKERVGCYEFVFEDNGIGMSSDFVERVFDPFERADDERVHQEQGTGLGMAITKNIVQMMSGDIRVESEPDVGSRFTVNIFLELQEDVDVSTEELQGLPVLVVDDDQISCESACLILDEIGMSSEWSLSGQEAIERVDARHRRGDDYFAVIMDWKMPGMNGIEATKAIRSLVGEEIPIIIFSAYDWADIELEARAAGADMFISKPLFKSRLTAAFKRLVGGEGQEMPTNSLEEMAKRDYSDKRILLVEDNELNMEIATEILEMTGVQIETAENGKVAIDMVAESPKDYYDLIFMDVQMPVMNGYQATAAIRALGRKDCRSVPIIAMTANAFAEDVIAAKNAGMNEHIAKPLDISRLCEVMGRWLGG